LKHQYLYGASTKKKQEAKMIKVQEDNYKECHRELAGMKQKITMGAGVASMLMMWFFST